MKRSPLIAAEDLCKSYAGARVVNDVSLFVEAGKIVTVIGPNGSGKTTLLKLLLGLETPDSGSVSREGCRIGYMPQRLQLNPILPLPVAWFLGLSGEGVLEIAARTRTEHLLKKPMHRLSGGEMQRVLLARALLTKPNLLVLDEPAQGVDVNGQAELYALIQSLAKERHMAVLMVSHDLHLVMAATDEVICLNGHVCCHGHPMSVRAEPAFAALFGQHVADSLAIYTHHHDHTH